MKKKDSGCAAIISLLKIIFGKQFRVIDKFADETNKSIMLLPTLLSFLLSSYILCVPFVFYV